MKDTDEMTTTTISISRRNHLRMMERGKKGQSFDDILTEMLNQTATNHQKQRQAVTTVARTQTQ
jgi:flagellar motor component MotA